MREKSSTESFGRVREMMGRVEEMLSEIVDGIIRTCESWTYVQERENPSTESFGEKASTELWGPFLGACCCSMLGICSTRIGRVGRVEPVDIDI